MDRPLFAIRGARPETHELFQHIVDGLNAVLPHGKISRAQTLDVVVSSAFARLVETGQMPPLATPRDTPAPAFVPGKAFRLTPPRPPDDPPDPPTT